MRAGRVTLRDSPVRGHILDGADTLTGTLATLVRDFPGYECLVLVRRDLSEERLTLERLWQRARAIQSGLLARGLPPGRIVVIIVPTSAELVSAYFGAMLAGAVPALVATPSNRLADPRAYAARVGRIADNAEAFALYADDEIAEILRAQSSELPGATAILTPRDVQGEGDAPFVAARPDAIATAQYSSGSTGPPKGVLLTHTAILNNIRALRRGLKLTTADISVNWIPLYHDMGLIDAFLLPLLSGCPTVLIPTMDFMREPSLWLWAIHRYRGAHAWAPNFAYTLCARRVPDAEIEGLDLSSWRLAVSAAEPILAPTVRAFARRFASHGFRPEAFTPVYGLAENVTAATAHTLDEPPRIETIDRGALATTDTARTTDGEGIEFVSTGKSLPGCTIEIRDEASRPLPERGVGTIWLKTDCLFSGYNRDPEATSATLVGGWLNTGDRGYLADGHLFFVSRDKDLIVVGGEKYSPHDIEQAVNEVPGVREGCAAVFGVLNEERGTEDLAAVVETKETEDGALERLRDAIRARVLSATGLALRHVILVPPGGVEKTTSGKLARRATRRRHAQQFEA